MNLIFARLPPSSLARSGVVSPPADWLARAPKLPQLQKTRSAILNRCSRALPCAKPHKDAPVRENAARLAPGRQTQAAGCRSDWGKFLGYFLLAFSSGWLLLSWEGLIFIPALLKVQTSPLSSGSAWWKIRLGKTTGILFWSRLTTPTDHQEKDLPCFYLSWRIGTNGHPNTHLLGSQSLDHSIGIRTYATAFPSIPLKTFQGECPQCYGGGKSIVPL